MGDYNPNAPTVLGLEWVPIRDEDVNLSPAVNAVEIGHGFTLDVDRQVREGRFYLNEFPSGDATGQTFMISLYAAGEEALSGPIASVIIPCDSGGVTGNTSFTKATTVVDAVADPSDGSNVTMSSGSPATSRVSAFFDTASYSALLTDKRILAVNLRYVITGDWAELTEVDGNFFITIANEAGLTAVYGWNGAGTISQVERGDINRTIQRLRFGEINQHWSTTLSPTNTPDRMPWTYPGLARFEASSANRIFVRFDMNESTSGIGIEIEYLALEVVYCEEQRVALGGRAFGLSATTNAFDPYTIGANRIPLRTVAEAADPILTAGDYTMMLSSADVGDFISADLVSSIPYPELNGLRQLYGIYPHPAVQTNIPFLVEDHIGDVFAAYDPPAGQVSRILPQLSLHASGGTLIEPHVYGRQGAAQVYAAFTATQDIDESPLIGQSLSWPQVRFYARRFGDTTIPLTLTGEASLSGSSVQITADEFDALTEIVDGWKEVTLRFDTPPSMGTVAGIPGWTWSAAGEDKGSRWEVLAACAPAISGLPGNLLNEVLYPNLLGPATYGMGAAQTPSFVAVGTASHGNNASVTPGAPAGSEAGDLWLIHAAIRNSPNGSPDRPAGYTQLLSSSNMRLFGKIYDGSEAAPTVTFSDGVANATTSAQIAAFRGVSLSVVTSADQLNGSAANIAFPGISSSAMEDNTLVLFLGWRAQDWTSVDTLAGCTEIGDPSSGLGDNQGIVWDFVVRGAAAAVGAGSFVVNGGVNGISRGAVVVMRHADPGSEVELTWLPWLGPYVSSPTADPDCDAVLIFSQDPPTIENLTLNAFTQEVTGLGLNCGEVPCCIPEGIFHHQLTWSATSLPASGFGAYELQRWDSTETDFATIMLATSPLVTGFNDFEARVGIDSVYRMRVLNLYNFAGGWSTQVTGAPASPGVTGGCEDQTGALIFTSNADQSGLSNAAYVMQWESTPTEDFTLPEAEEVVFQPMYNRDGSVAFHGTERGLESFARTLLIHAGAIDPIRLADVKTLRDLAWADLPYVCVRDELGDRWFANVRVPTVNARQNRTSYMARVEIVETTRTPAAVDP